MAATKVLARGWTFAINTGTEAVPVWTPIKGIASFSVSPSKADADFTDFDSAGIEEHQVSSRGLEVTLEGFHLEDPADGTRDAGQTAVETVADAVGAASIDQFKITSPGAKTWTFKGSAEVTAPGGGKDDAASWSVTLKRTGATTKA